MRSRAKLAGKSPVQGCPPGPSRGPDTAYHPGRTWSFFLRVAGGLLWLVATPSIAALPVIDNRIDPHAQFALLDLAKHSGRDARDAALILAAVKTGRLGGIYLDNQGVPALRAQAWNTKWFNLIPKGFDAVVLPAPPSEAGGRPILALRHTVATIPARRNAALLDGWRSFLLLDTGVLRPCAGGAAWVRQVVMTKHCLPPAPLPASLVAPRSGFVSDGTILSGWDKRFNSNNPQCWRAFKPYDQCKASIGKIPEMPPIQPASVHEGSSAVKPKALTEPMLLRIFAPRLVPVPPNANPQAKAKAQQQRNLQISRIKQALPYLEEAFELFLLDTVRSRAHVLAHYGGELGGDPSFFGLREIGADNASYAPFVGRGPLQVTKRPNYALTLAYAEHRMDMLSAESTARFNEVSQIVDQVLAQGTFNTQDVAKIDAAARAHEQAVRNWVRVMTMTEGIRGNIDRAHTFEDGVLFSGAFWQAALCWKSVKTMGPVATTTEFVGSNRGAACVAGGATSASGNAQAIKKAQIYNIATKELGWNPGP